MLTDAYLGLGSNLGDRRANILEGLERLRERFGDVKASSIYETDPVGFAGQPPFMNAACRLWTDLDAFSLLSEIQKMQVVWGKRRAFVNGPRTLDIDILVFGRAVFSTPNLTVPHPRMAQRQFVLLPLSEIAPGLVHPVLGVTVRDLLDSL
ncbi:MAG: 2-amino-4-hydroxy-6-hydroxymethyldihydropteridine diphosphokinase [SAR202 cluster bacterium]|nr:2-amino-4-hydroxy-6-hydroxymethyldihydropteridine diphosphokinase [SAR202 cluster bacterium]